MNDYDGNDDYYYYEYEEDVDEDYESNKDYDYESDQDYEEYEYDRKYSSSNESIDVSDSNIEADNTFLSENDSKDFTKENGYDNVPTTSTHFSNKPVAEGSGWKEIN